MVALLVLLVVVIGAAGGFAVHRLIGCRSGACPIWSNPYAATIYGAILGFLIGVTLQ